MSTDSPKTLSVHVRIPFTDHNGPHLRDEIVEVPYETAVQVSEADSLISYGVVATTARSDTQTAS